jgi:hypothetical protein
MIIKKGTKYTLHCCTHDVQSQRTSDIYELEEDITEEQLDKEAEDFMWNAKEPEWWYEIIEEEV